MPSPDRNIVVNGSTSYDYVTRNSSGSVIASGHVGSVASTWAYNDALQTVSVRTPGFRKMKKHELPINAYSKYQRYYNAPQGSFQQTAKILSSGSVVTYDYVTRGSYMFGHPIPRDTSLDADDPTQRIVGELQEKLSRTKSQLPVTMLEMGKTAAHLAKTAKRISDGLIALRKGRFGDFTQALGISATNKVTRYWDRGYNRARKADGSRAFRTGRFSRQEGESRVTDFAADTWLEYSYAWKPLMYDLYNTAEAAASVMVEYQGVVRTETARHSNYRTTESSDVNGQFIIYQKTFAVNMGEIGVNYRIPDGVISPAVAFGLNNPLAVAWELVPFSFVVDWFLPVGEAINAITAYDGLVFHSGYHSTRQIIRRNRDLRPGPMFTSGGVQYRCTAASCSDELFELGTGRTPIYWFPEYGYPKLKDPRSFAHAASAISLLQSIFLRNVR